MILAFETSCDETSVAIVKDGQILSNELYSQIRHHRKFGGVVPELASRLHAEYVDQILDRALASASVNLSDISHIAVTVGPGLEGALLVGITAANTLAQFLNVPLIPVNHLHGHIFAAKDEFKLRFPAIVCLASGGHTMIIEMPDPYQFKFLCNTMDDACGEAFDKVARMLDLGYPGGPQVEQLAKSGAITVPLPHPVKPKKNMFSFSGLKTAVLSAINSQNYTREDVAASFQFKVAEILAYKLEFFIKQHHYEQLILCGGVFANQTIRSHLSNSLSIENVVVPSLKLCTDNAGMIGLAAESYLQHPKIQQFKMSCYPQLGLNFPGVK
ncbi:MAG: tRNA (adenosine(37)-N6)-threonylcarbamoyltransferase complex transferase subunit TsaD [Candidatus Margulisiibacteriota bacterium]